MILWEDDGDGRATPRTRGRLRTAAAASAGAAVLLVAVTVALGVAASLSDDGTASEPSSQRTLLAFAVLTGTLAAAAVGLLLRLSRNALARVGALEDHLRVRGQQLVEVGEQLDATQELAHVGSLTWYPDDDRLDGSAQFWRLLGLRPGGGPLSGARALSFVHPDDRHGYVVDTLTESVGSGADATVGFRLVRADGAVREVEAHVQGRGAGEDASAVRAMLHDVTDRVLAARAKNEYLSLLTHQLRTPLTSVRGALGLLAGGAAGTLPGQADRMVRLALSGTQGLVRLVGVIVDLERVAVGGVQLSRGDCEAGELVAAAAREVGELAAARGVVVDAVPPPSPCPLEADEERVVQALHTLLTRAVRATPAGGRVGVTVGTRGAGVVVEVTDEGAPGSADGLRSALEQVEHLAATPVRADAEAGVSLVHAAVVVRAHGGRLDVADATDGGTVVTVFLPGAHRPTGLPADLGSGCVVVCDADPLVVESLCQGLEAHGQTVLRASSVGEVVRLAGEQPVTAVVLDFKLPGSPGSGTAGALRRERALDGVPVLVMSAFTLEADDSPTPPRGLSLPTAPVEAPAGTAGWFDDDGAQRVLVVEDDEELAEVMRLFFRQHGLRASVAHTGAQAVAMALDSPPDLIVLDIGLPDLDGYSVVEALRLDERLRDTPLLVHTGADLDPAQRQRLRLGPTRFLAKGGGRDDQLERQVSRLLGAMVRPAGRSDGGGA